MRIAIGSDHRGFLAKGQLIDYLRQLGHDPLDEGTYGVEQCDYPDIASKVARRVACRDAERGILICGTGIGMQITANKFAGVRAAVCHDENEAALSRRHNDTNVLCLSGSPFTEDAGMVDRMQQLIQTWLATEFEGGRHARRIEKIHHIEQQSRGPKCDEPDGRQADGRQADGRQADGRQADGLQVDG